MAEAVFARNLSAIKGQRVEASKAFPERPSAHIEDRDAFLADLEQAVYANKIIAYAQGFQLLSAASDEHGWDLKLGDIALLWREGCIIRAGFLDRIKSAYSEGKKVVNLILTDEFREEIRAAIPGLTAASSPRPSSAASTSPRWLPLYSIFDGYTSEKLEANMCQAQRDWFGAHTFHRDDRPHDESFHHEWEKLD
jgi:6-phosphogluconate dehydrogenase